MYAVSTISDEHKSETLIEVYSQVWDPRERRVVEDEYRLACWGGSNFMTGEPYIVFTPPDGLPSYSVKQENLYKVFLLAANVHFILTGEVDYRPKKVFDAYDVIYPEPNMSRAVPKFKVF